jgi:NTE family protein
VLGSGGARGLAHIGIIQLLIEEGFDIRSISGSSIGALIGGIYAAGKLEVYTDWVRALERLDIIRLLDFSFGRSGLLKGERIINALKELIGDHNIEELPISFTAVATDVDAEKEVWLNRGPLFDAIRASIAIPTIFPPCDYNGRKLLDGGLINPIPIAPTLKDITDITIAVNLGAKPEAGFERPAPRRRKTSTGNKYQLAIREFVEGPQQRLIQREDGNMGLFHIVSRSMETMQNTVARLKLAAYSPDFIIDIPRNVCAFFEFDRADEMIAIGRERAGKVLPEIT